MITSDSSDHFKNNTVVTQRQTQEPSYINYYRHFYIIQENKVTLIRCECRQKGINKAYLKETACDGLYIDYQLDALITLVNKILAHERFIVFLT